MRRPAVTNERISKKALEPRPYRGEPSLLLAAAIGTLEQGWCKGALMKNKSGESVTEGPIHACCLYGHLLFHADRHAIPPKVLAHLIKAIRHYAKDIGYAVADTGPIVAFNDAPERTLDDVLQIARHALGSLQKEEADR